MSVPIVGVKAQAPRTLVLTRALRIDGEKNDLSTVLALAVARDGAIALGLPPDHAIKFFAQDGRFLGQVGREGAGPREFRQILKVGWKADTLWAFDGTLRRLSLISPQREFVRTLLVPMGTRSPGGEVAVSGLAPLGVTGPDALLASGIAADKSQQDAWVTRFVRTNEKGAWGGESAATPVDQCPVFVADVRVRIPFCSSPVAGAAPDGDRVFVLSTSAQGQSQFNLTVISTKGDTLVSGKYVMPPTELPKAVFDSVLGRSLDRLQVTGPKRLVVSAQVTRPRYYGPVSQGLLGRDGAIWVGQDLGGMTRWLVIDEKGKVLGTATSPGNVRLMAVAKDRAWGVENVEGIESVVRYSLRGQ